MPLSVSLIASKADVGQTVNGVNIHHGIAPCAIHFDATGTTDTATIYPFHECYYEWDFGDPNSGRWEYGAIPGKLKNKAVGAIAAHVFETPGTYTVTLRVTSQDGSVSVRSTVVTVVDADVVYSGANTLCVNTSGDADFTGAPVGAQTIQLPAGNSFYTALSTYLASDKRVLLKRGSVYVSDTTSTVSVDNWILGAYGTGAKPKVTGSGNTSFLYVGTMSGIHQGGKLLDLNYDGVANVANNAVNFGVNFSGDFNDFLMLRTDLINVYNGIHASSYNTGLIDIWDNHAYVDCKIEGGMVGAGSGGNHFYAELQRSAVLGCLIDRGGVNEHCYRMMYAYKVVISNNLHKAPASTKACLTIRAPDWDFVYGPLPANTYTDYVIVSNNNFRPITSGANASCGAGGDGAQEAKVRNVIFERNKFEEYYGTGLFFLTLTTSLSTVRNNVFDMSVPDYAIAISIARSGTGATAPDTNWVYNNTGYTNVFNGSGVRVVSVGSAVYPGAVNTTIKNNLLATPKMTPGADGNIIPVDDKAGNTNTIGATGTFGNSSVAQAKTYPYLLSSTVPWNTSDLVLASGTYARNGGVAVPVFEDFFGTRRNTSLDGTIDIGAVETTKLNYKKSAQLTGINNINLVVTPSVTTGVAPLAVFFDATGTTSNSTSEPWRDILYGFDYGDPGAGNYTYGAQQTSKNRNLGGPCGGHVYETPGTYTATIYAYSGKRIEKKRITITVQDPDVVYAGTNTICLSTGAAPVPGVDGVPTGAACYGGVTTFQAGLAAHIASNKRILFKSGDNWTATSGLSVSNKVNTYIGSFGGKATISATIGLFADLLSLSGTTSNLRVCDLEVDFNSVANNSRFIGQTSSGVTNPFVLLNNIHIYNGSYLFISDGISVAPNLALHKCLADNLVGGIGAYIHASNFLILDSKIDGNLNTTQNIRFQYANKGLISGVTSINSGSSYECLTIRGPTWTGGSQKDIPAGTYSEYVVVSNSIFSKAVSVKPQNGTVDERIRRCIFENNYFQSSLNLFGFQLSARNNVFNNTGGGTFSLVLTTGGGTGIAGFGHSLYNNTYYKADSGAEGYFISIAATDTRDTVSNNLQYTPLVTTAVVLATHGSTVASSNNTSNVNAKTVNPLFVNASGNLNQYSDFRLQPTSPYRGFGANVFSNWVDGNGFLRESLTPDAGALNSEDHSTGFWGGLVGLL